MLPRLRAVAYIHSCGRRSIGLARTFRESASSVACLQRIEQPACARWQREHIAADPDTLDNQAHPENKQVLAEELAHIVQKRRGSVVPDAVDEHGPEQGCSWNSVRRES